MGYEWDERKNKTNLQKHGVSFEEAITVFEDPLSQVSKDDSESYEEERFIIFGRSKRERELFVVYCERQNEFEKKVYPQETVIRIISARKLTTKERRHLEQLRF
jgi:uncharacterized DUF497 family protein